MFKLVLRIYLITLTFQKNAYFFSDINTDKITQLNTQFSDLHLKDLISSNLGVIEQVPLDQVSQQLIKTLGKTNLMSPILLNYIFIIESNEMLASQKGVPIQLEICKDNQSCIFDAIFDKQSESSIVSQIKKQYKSKLAYLYVSDPKSMMDYGENILYISQRNNGLYLKERDGTWQIQIKKSLYQCVNDFLNQTFTISDNQVYGDKGKFQVNSDQSIIFQNWLQDLCAVVEISKLVREEGKQPNIFTFYLQSFGKLEKLLNLEEKLVLYDIWRITLENFQRNIEKHFQIDQISGQLIFTKQITDAQRFQKRILQTENEKFTAEKDSSYLIQIWLSVTMIIVLWYVLSCMFNMEIAKDSLLYAKFLTVDQK